MTKEKNPFREVRMGNEEALFELLNLETLNQLDEEQGNLLHVAIAFSQEKIALRLIQMGIQLNQQDYNGQSPLHFAAEFMQLNICRAILEGGGNPDLADRYGNTPLAKAAFNARGQYEIVKLFMEFGADANIKNNAGKSALDLALMIKDTEMEAILRS